MLTGFTFKLGNKDIFIVTEKKNKTQQLASEILRKLQKSDNPSTRKEVLSYLLKGKLDKRSLSNGREYYEIFGDNFGGRGGFVDENTTEIIYL